MSSIPRIVAVDPSYEVARIMRGALSLLNRQYILVEMPTAEDVLYEVQTSQVDLVVTTYQLAEDMNGIELATRVNHDSLRTAVIVLADEHDPRLDKEALKDVPFQYYMRPVGEEILRGVRVALDGEAAVEQETRVVESGLDLGPVPAINVDALRALIGPLMRDVGAMGIILADRNGRILVDEGATGYIDREKLAVIMGPLFARAVEVSPLVGGDAWSMVYYDGERLDVFGLALGVHYFMGLVFEGSNRGAFGAVNHFGRRAVDQMIDMIGEAAYQVKAPEPLPPVAQPPKAAAPKAGAPKAAASKSTPPARAKSTPAPTKKSDRAPAQDRETAGLEAMFDAAPATPSGPTMEPVRHFDPEKLFGQAVDESLADSMFDPDALEDLAESLSAENSERVGYDEAFDMGILDDLK